VDLPFCIDSVSRFGFCTVVMIGDCKNNVQNKVTFQNVGT